MGTTSIEWTEKTWNPLRGCSPVSPGCKNCYAERIAARFSGPGQPFEGFATWRRKSGAQEPIAREDLKLWPPGEREPAWTGKVALLPEKLIEPLTWRDRTRVFVNSMSDLFHEELTFAEIAQVFAIMAIGGHTYQVLTKRPARALEFFAWMEKGGEPIGKLGDLYGLHISPMRMPKKDVLTDYDMTDADLDLEAIYESDWPLENVWLGVSTENQRFCDERVPILLQCPAAKRFVSYEPALEPVQFHRWLCNCDGDLGRHCRGKRSITRPGLDWVIVGGESDHGAREFEIEWARSVVADCKATNVPVFVKQLGAKPCAPALIPPIFPALIKMKLKHKKGADMEEWPEDLRIREYPT